LKDRHVVIQGQIADGKNPLMDCRSEKMTSLLGFNDADTINRRGKIKAKTSRILTTYCNVLPI